MVKFVELFKYIGRLEDLATCSCCRHETGTSAVFTVDGKMVILCDHCREFLEEVLD